MADQTNAPDSGSDGSDTNDRPTARRSPVPGLPSPPRYDAPDDDRGFYADAGFYGVMYAGDYEWDNERCTAEAFGDYDSDEERYNITRNGQPHRSLQFHTTWMGVETAKRCVSHIGTYNRFDAEACQAVLDDLPRPVAVVVGREQSPVIYVWTGRPRTVLSKFYGMGDGRHAPDELGAYPDGDHYPRVTIGEQIQASYTGTALCRFWWD